MAQAQCPRFAMPTVSVKRDLLFQALGRTYSECPPRSLGSVPGGSPAGPAEGRAGGVWPCPAGVCGGRRRARTPAWAEAASRNRLCSCIIRRCRDLRVIHSFRGSSHCMPGTDCGVGTQTRKDALGCITSVGSSVGPD